MHSRDQRALVAGGLLLTMMLGYAWVARPALNRLARDREMLVEQQGLLSRERGLLAAAPSLEMAQRSARASLTSAQARMFDGDSVAATAQLASFVTDVARATGVELTSANSRNPQTEGGVASLGVEIRGEGNWRQVLTFLRAVESSARLVEISRVRLERGARGGPLGGDHLVLAATITGYGRVAP